MKKKHLKINDFKNIAYFFANVNTQTFPQPNKSFNTTVKSYLM